MPTAYQVEVWKRADEKKKREKVAPFRPLVPTIPEVAAASVLSALEGTGHTLDHDETGRRWVFNKHGELIHTIEKRYARVHPWTPGLRRIVHTA